MMIGHQSSSVSELNSPGLYGSAFGPEDVGVMRAAFEDAHSDRAVEVVACRTTTLAKQSERDPSRRAMQPFNHSEDEEHRPNAGNAR